MRSKDHSIAVDGVRERLYAAFSAGWLTRQDRPDVQPQDAFERYFAAIEGERG
jgi:hypothetical protein